MFLFGGGKSPRRPGERVAPATPARILTSYARTSEELQLFLEDLAACSPAKHLDWEEALEAFPDGVIPSAWFELGGRRWQLTARAGADGRRVLHLATPLAASPEAAGRELALQTQQQQQSSQQQQASQQRRRGSGRPSKQPLLLGSAADEPRSRALMLHGGGLRFSTESLGGQLAVAGCRTPSSGSGSPCGDDYTLAAAANGASWSGSDGSDGGANGSGGGGGGAHGSAGAKARRKYVRDIVVATNPAHDSLGRYKALIALIEHCKARAAALRPGQVADWGREPAHSLLHAIVDVGEALAGFGNAHFPERSGEARAVLAADYKALLSEYLRHLGGVLAPGACRGVAPETEAELRSVGSLLSTRCEAYKVLYDQIVRHVGSEGRGGGGGGGFGASAPCLIVNTNWNTVDASPVTTNTNTATAASKAKALNQGLGAAAIAAAALGAVLLARAVLRGGGGGGSRSGSSPSSASSPRPARLPRGKNGREMALVSVLSACGDELRKAGRNEALLQDDWRLGRVRLAWPPAPAPQGYAPLTAEVCDVTGALQELYGR